MSGNGPIAPGAIVQQTLLAETTCAASGAYAATSVIKVEGYRLIILEINNDCAAAAGYPVLIPRLSSRAGATAPAFGDDVWQCVGVTDGAPVATLFTGTRVTGVDYTGAPEFGVLTFRPLAIRTEAHDAGTNEIRMRVPIDVTGARWFSIEYAEVGTTGTPSAVGIDYVLVN